MGISFTLNYSTLRPLSPLNLFTFPYRHDNNDQYIGGYPKALFKDYPSPQDPGFYY